MNLLSKINKFSNRADTLYQEFKVYVLMDEASVFLDELSNWYVRRNRRRFWKSENDSDKNAAYYTLHTALVKYLKIISPVIPFISDYMYQNLNCKDESIHLSDYPISDSKSIDNNLIEEIDTLLEVVSIGRSARNNANIKIRQPLSEVVIYCNDSKYENHLLNNKNDILEELNVKDIRFVNQPSEISETKIKPDFQVLRQKFKDNMKEVLVIINQLDIKELLDIVNNK